MKTSSLSQAEETTNRNLRRLFVLRNIAIIGQILVISIVPVWFKITLPINSLIVIVVALSIWNLITWIRIRLNRPFREREFFFQMLPDVFALTAMLYFTGGATNPFAWVFLFPLIIAATVLPKPYTWVMALLTTACYSLLMIYFVPLPMSHMGHGGDGFGQHVLGMWFGFSLTAALIAYFVSDMANTLHIRDRILAEAREQALRDERLIALGTLAAGAAHELGTPLGTMAILAGELEKEYPAETNDELHGKLVILCDQIKRCKKALSVISASAGDGKAESGQMMEADKYLEKVIDQWQKVRPEAILKYTLNGNLPAPNILADEVLNQAITSILNNAADASPKEIELNAQWNNEQLQLEVSDRGDGLSPKASLSVGKQLFSTKKHGLGLGLFLAHAAINRLGGNVELINREGGGVTTRVTIPLMGSA